MYYPIEGGSVYEVPDNSFGFTFLCNLPPVGYGQNSITGEYEKTDIIKNSDIEEEQCWQRYVLPKEWYAKRKAEKERQQFDSDYFDPYVEFIRAREWRRRLLGVWFWNYNPKKGKSELLYITGTHYLYITYWKFQGKLHDFRINDMEFWYVMKYCETDPNCLGISEITKRKLGKCFKINTLIRMYDGSVKKVQDIKNGEYVMGDDSTSRLVSGTTSGEEEMFEIIPNKGNPFTVNKSHILHCIIGSQSKKKVYSKKYVNITVEDYLKSSPCMQRRLRIRRSGWGDNFKKQEHLVDPYFIGVWLGDGASKNLSIANEDEEIVEYLKTFSITHKLKYSVNKKAITKSGNLLKHYIGQTTRNIVEFNGEIFENKQILMRHLGKHPKTPLYTFGLYKKGKIKIVESLTNEVWNEFKRLNLPMNKHIPKEYLIDSKENRLILLAGIIDTDGCLVKYKNGKPNHYKIALSNKYKRLQDDLVELVQSLGFYCGVRNESNNVNAKVFTIFGEIWKIPCKIERKIATKYDKKYTSKEFGFSVKPIGVDKYYGFAVDGNNLFLLSDGTVVHNTAKLGCWIYDRTSKPPFNQHAAFQSKADPDAEEVMKKAIVQPWQKLPDFFRPIYDTMKGDDPNELRFFHTSRRGSTTETERVEEALESWIEYGASGEAVFDGPELYSYGSDETSKTKKPVSIKERQNVVRYCAEIDGEFGNRKQYYTTTVEIEKGEEDNPEFQELTAMSNPLERDDNGRTMTGLYTYFLPAQKGMYFDKYGYPDEERALTFLNNAIKKYEQENKLRELSSFKRKNPRFFKEAFSTDGEHALYNPGLLNPQLDNITWTNKFTEFGNLEWVDGKRLFIEKELPNGDIYITPSKVKWVSSPTGKFERIVGWKPKEENSVYYSGGRFHPNNNFAIRIGCDPFRYDKTKDKRRSNCAAFAYQIPDELYPDELYDDAFVLRYSYREESTRAANEDVLKMAWWCGCQVLFERNVNHWKNDFIDNNCSPFLMFVQGEVEPGIITAGTAVQTICNYTEAYINKFINKVYFKTLIRKDTGWLGFKVEDTEKFDEPMAAGITLISVHGAKRKIKQKVMDIKDYFPNTAAWAY